MKKFNKIIIKNVMSQKIKKKLMKSYNKIIKTKNKN